MSAEQHAVRPWERDDTFHQELYQWLERAPWLAISLAAHFLVFLVLAAIPWHRFEQPVETPLVLRATEVLDEPFFEEEPEEPRPEDEAPDEPDDPVLVDADVPVDPEPEPARTAGAESLDLGREEAFGEIGLGDGPAGAGKLSERFGPRGRRGSGKHVESALAAGLEWLKAHQSPDGSWDGNGFARRCGSIGASVCGGAGSATHDVGLTGLALLAFLGEGSTTTHGTYTATVRKGIDWLRKQQDRDTGLFGERASHDFVYDHAIATLAVCEAYAFSTNPILRRTAQKAVDYVQAARDPYRAWRYDVPSAGDNDTSVTGWMVLALASARDAGLKVDDEALAGALGWLDEVTDPTTGRVGYDEASLSSSRTPANAHFPPEEGEAMTAVALLCRFFLGQDPEHVYVMHQHADLLARTPPLWDPEAFGNDMYYWYYGSYAMFQMGGERWRAWRDAMEDAVLRSQSRTGDERGSWDPIGPWGHVGGRVYATALMTLCLEVYFRYGKILGGR